MKWFKFKKDILEKYKKRSTLVETVGDIEIWTDKDGLYRLICDEDVFGIDFPTLDKAIREANKSL
jgi:hypothetical protein